VLTALERKGLLSAQEVHDIKLAAREAERREQAAVVPAPGAAAPTPAAAPATPLQQAAAALCRHLPDDKRPPIKLVSLHIWTMAHGVASLFAQEGRASRKVPMSPEDVLESGLLIYLKGLGVLPDEREEPSS